MSAKKHSAGVVVLMSPRDCVERLRIELPASPMHRKKRTRGVRLEAREVAFSFEAQSQYGCATAAYRVSADWAYMAKRTFPNESVSLETILDRVPGILLVGCFFRMHVINRKVMWMSQTTCSRWYASTTPRNPCILCGGMLQVEGPIIEPSDKVANVVRFEVRRLASLMGLDANAWRSPVDCGE